MSFYSNLSNIALNQIKAKGILLTFSTVTVDSFDPELGRNNTTASTYSSYGLSLNYKSGLIDGTIIKSGDIRLLMDSTTEPKINDKVTIDSKSYKIISVKQTNPAGIAVMYEAQLRK